MQPIDTTIEVLQGIRDEVKDVCARIGETNYRLDQTNVRLGRLERRQADSEIRLATEIDAVRDVRDLLRDDRGLRGRVDDHERRPTAIEQARG